MKGFSEDQVIGELGAPDRTGEAGSYKVWYYTRTYGTKTSQTWAGNTQFHPEFDKYELFFKEGVLDHTRFEVHRSPYWQ